MPEICHQIVGTEYCSLLGGYRKLLRLTVSRRGNGTHKMPGQIRIYKLNKLQQTVSYKINA